MATEAKEDQKIDYRDLPPCRLSIRGRSGIDIRTGPFNSSYSSSPIQHIESGGGDGSIFYSVDGCLLGVNTYKQIEVYDVANQGQHTLLGVIARPRVEHCWFSPLGTFIVTWHRKTNDTKTQENLLVWNVRGEQVIAFHLNELDLNQDRPVQFTSDEAFLFFLFAHELRIYSGSDPSKDNILHRFSLEHLSEFSVAPCGAPYRFAAFQKGANNSPAKINIFALHNFQLLSTKSFFKAEEITMKWSPTSQSLLVETRTSTDATGKSYYGESNLHLLHLESNFTGTVPFGTNAGPIQDVAWSPTGKEFMVIQGFQPAKSTLFVASTCTPIREYGTGSRNTIRWSPHGRFVVLGGFGNLAGEMEFWDHFKFKKMGMAVDRDGAKSYEWTPDGRNFVTASLRPWRRVDNGYKVWTYYGEQLYHEKFEELYQVLVQPAPPNLYPNRPQSPRLIDARKAAAAQPEPVVVKAYVPPHLRAQGAGPSTIMKRDTDSAPRKLNQQERAAITGNTTPSKEADELSKNQLKRKKLKENQKKREEEEKKAAEEAEQKAAEEAAAALAAAANDPVSVGKKIKALNKKLRQIAELKEKQASGATLEDAQIEKINSEPDLNQELDSLTKHLATLSAQ